MGIPGIYKELGPGNRISLAKLSVEQLEKTNQRFRLAIDISIWQFQIQSGQGGRNPALRTLYYRLLRLLGLGIQPLFVFDGPYKPKVKRNVQVAPNTACLDNFLTKHLLERFGFPYHDAPGEAEAECALLQKEGIVDAVLSEDVDTMMFGCTMSLRNWTSEGARSNKPPTHVSMYTAESNEKGAGLDSHGMILVALMSGGDYDTEGLSKCGPKTACDAARAGFGRELCQLAKDDYEGWRKWREKLQHELHTNESKFFKQKHKAISIPETFPDRTVLDYYKRPAVSSSEKVVRLRESIKWDTNIDIPELRDFVAEAFNWTYLIGTRYFIRTFAPVLLTHKLLEKNTKDDLTGDGLEAKATAEAQFITSIHGRRTHWNTDGCPELRVSYIPADIVGLDLSLEEDIDRADDAADGLEVDGEDSNCEERSRSVSPTKRRGPSAYDPTQPEKIWMSETFLKLGVPLLVETWEEDMRDPKKFATRKACEKAALSKAQKGPPHGAMDQYVKITKPLREAEKGGGVVSEKDSRTALTSTILAPTITTAASTMALKALRENRNPSVKTQSKKSASSEIQQPSNKAAVEKKVATPTSPHNPKANPWTFSKRPSDTYRFKSPTRYSALGIYAPNDPESHESRFRRTTCPFKSVHNEQSPPPAMERISTEKHSRGASASTSCDSSTDEGARALDNVTLRTPRKRNTAKPSPRNKRSPLEMANDLFSAGHLKTPTTTRKERDVIDLSDSDAEQAALGPLAATKANRRLDFTSSINPAEQARGASPASSDSSLPSPKALFPPTPKLMAAFASPSTTEAHRPAPPSSQIYKLNKRDKNFITLRESLEGAWKHIEQWQVSGDKDVFTGVEVLDMTSSQ